MPQCGSLDATQEAFVGLPGATSGDKATRRVDDGATRIRYGS